MLDNYLIVHKSVLPDYYEKVLDAKRLIENGTAKDVSAAVKIAGISRSTYYKYKDYVMLPSEMDSGRRAVVAITLLHEPGVLSAVLKKISDAGASVLTITQSLPIRDKANVTMSLDLSGFNGAIDELMKDIASTPGAERPKLLAIE